ELREPLGLGRRRRRWTRGGGAGTLLFEPLTAVERANLVFAVQSQLHVQPLEAGQIGLDLLRQLAEMARPELAGAPLVVVELAPGVGELGLEELGRPRRLALADPRVLLHVHAGELVGNSCDGVGLRAAVADGEGDRRRAAAESRLD